MLAKLGNKLQPGAVDMVYEGDAAKDKEHATSNIQKFFNFITDNGVATAEDLPPADDVQEAKKSSFKPLLCALVKLGTQAPQRFSQLEEGATTLGWEQLLAAAANGATLKAQASHLLQQLINLFKKRPATQGKVIDAAPPKSPSEKPEAAVQMNGNGTEAHAVVTSSPVAEHPPSSIEVNHHHQHDESNTVVSESVVAATTPAASTAIAAQ